MTLEARKGSRISVSTWSLHRTLGRPQIYGVGQEIPLDTHNRGAVTLLELPARLAQADIRTLEICHFHLLSREPAYLRELRAALEAANIELFSLLVDDGDITHPTNGARAAAWIEQWLEVAGELGARRMRVIAGKTAASEETLAHSAQTLLRLAQRAQEHGVRLMTENWFGLLAHPQAVLDLFQQLNGEVGLCLDFGNWEGARKYDDLAAIAHLAESCHTKADFSAQGELDQDDYVRCLEITKAAHFSGPYTLIYAGPDDDEWQGLATERAIVQRYL